MTVIRALLRARESVEAGVTTVRDLGGRDYVEMAVRRAVHEGWAPGPRILAAGKAICMTGGHGWWIGREADGPGRRAQGRARAAQGRRRRDQADRHRRGDDAGRGAGRLAAHRRRDARGRRGGAPGGAPHRRPRAGIRRHRRRGGGGHHHHRARHLPHRGDRRAHEGARDLSRRDPQRSRRHQRGRPCRGDSRLHGAEVGRGGARAHRELPARPARRCSHRRGQRRGHAAEPPRRTTLPSSS